MSPGFGELGGELRRRIDVEEVVRGGAAAVVLNPVAVPGSHCRCCIAVAFAFLLLVLSCHHLALVRSMFGPCVTTLPGGYCRTYGRPPAPLGRHPRLGYLQRDLGLSGLPKPPAHEGP